MTERPRPDPILDRARHIAADLDHRQSIARIMLRFAYDAHAVVDDFRRQVDRIAERTSVDFAMDAELAALRSVQAKTLAAEAIR